MIMSVPAHRVRQSGGDWQPRTYPGHPEANRQPAWGPAPGRMRSRKRKCRLRKHYHHMDRFNLRGSYPGQGGGIDSAFGGHTTKGCLRLLQPPKAGRLGRQYTKRPAPPGGTMRRLLRWRLALPVVLLLLALPVFGVWLYTRSEAAAQLVTRRLEER